MPAFKPPTHRELAFNCPVCYAYAAQTWGRALQYRELQGSRPIDNCDISTCSHCGQASIWISGKLLYPIESSAPPANPDIPPEVREDYDEARSILSTSPRGAAALLRLAIQKLCKFLDEPGQNLNDDIASLVRKGLTTRVQQALDVVRVIGNESVHPGQIDLRDDPVTATALFELVNLITDQMVSQPNKVDTLYRKLPQEKREQIERRDSSP